MNLPPALVLLRRLVSAPYDGGYNGTCLDCPFADGPFGDKRGGPHDYVNNSDHTEAYFRCNLPGRDNETLAWGEYAPCTDVEWFDGVLAAKALPAPTLGAGSLHLSGPSS